MGKKAQIEETRYIELDIPQEIMLETAEIIEANEIEASILGRSEEDEDCITVGFEYAQKQRESMMEIFELIEDFNEDDGEEESEEEDEN